MEGVRKHTRSKLRRMYFPPRSMLFPNRRTPVFRRNPNKRDVRRGGGDGDKVIRAACPFMMLIMQYEYGQGPDFCPMIVIEDEAISLAPPRLRRFRERRIWFMPVDQHEIPDVHEQAHRLTETDHRILPPQRIPQQHGPAADRQVPECNRHRGLTLPFRGHSLDKKPGEKADLPEHADQAHGGH